MNIFYITIIAVAVIIAIAFLVYKIKTAGLRAVAIKFIVEAEKIFEYGKNTEKFNYAFDCVYGFVPNYLRIFVTKEVIIKFIQKIFDEVKIALDYQK